MFFIVNQFKHYPAFLLSVFFSADFLYFACKFFVFCVQDYNGEQRELAEVIGLEAYKKLVERYGGSHVYINKADTI